IEARLRALSGADRNVGAELIVRFLFSCLVDADFLDTSAFYDPMVESLRGQSESRQATMAELADRIEHHLEKLSADALPGPVQDQRREVLSACRAAAEKTPGIFELTVPTGGGKTLAGMAFALRHAARHGLRRV